MIWKHPGSLCLLAILALAGCFEDDDPFALEDGPVLLISLDTMRQDALGCYGYPRPVSPHIDRFAADAVLFEGAVANASSTMPSHASLFTSLNVPVHQAHGGFEHVLAHEFETLAEILQQHGFHTAAFTDGGFLRKHFQFDQGFDEYSDDGIGLFERTVDRAAEWLDRRDTDEFLLFLHTYEVHHPYQPSAEDVAWIEPAYAGPLPDQASIELLKEINDGKVAIDAADAGHLRHLYQAEVRSLDRAFGRLMEALQQRGLYDRALIIVTADHGEEFGEHGLQGWHSTTLYDELLKVPLLVKFPDSAAAGLRVGGQVRGIDVLPTLADVLDVPLRPQFEGRSLLTAIRRGHARGRRLISSLVDRSFCLRTQRWKLYDDRLYDLTADPLETTDVASLHPDVTANMQRALREYLDRLEQGEATTRTIDAETQAQLEQLGYVK